MTSGSPGLTSRSRPLGVKRGVNEFSYRQYNEGNEIGSYYPPPSAEWAYGGSQYTESEGHPFRSSKNKGMEDLGGDFFTTKSQVFCADPVDGEFNKRFDGSPISYNYRYKGLICSVDPSSHAPSAPWDPYSNEVDLDAAGTEAIARVAPTNPVVSLTTALAEIKKDGLPHLPAISQNWRDRTQVARDAGDEYLNAQFGWSPLVNDASSFLGNVTHARSVIEQYKRGIGRPIRRNYSFPMERKDKSTLLQEGTRPHMYIGGSTFYSPGDLWLHQTMLRKRWFSGCFTYYFPSEILGSKGLADLALVAQRFGLTPTPEVLWNVAPWSWAVDWFSNAGDVITNWTNFHHNGLVMRYGYIMEHTIITSTYSLENYRPLVGGAPQVSDVTYVKETKIRRRAHPYGFGVSWDGLSAFQGSILASLGLSKSR